MKIERNNHKTTFEAAEELCQETEKLTALFNKVSGAYREGLRKELIYTFSAIVIYGVGMMVSEIAKKILQKS